MNAVVPPDQAAFRHHLAAAEYRCGEMEGRWRLLEINWPYVQIAVTAEPRPGAPSECVFRFTCDGYPIRGVTAQPWDKERNQPLPGRFWPGGRGVVQSVFLPNWMQGTCLYLPADRMTITGHPAWRTQHPSRLWQPSRGILCYLEQIHDLLASSDYLGLHGP